MRLRAVPRIMALAMLAAFLLPAAAHAQLTRGAISGTVRDQQGAVVPGAAVTVKNLATGATRSSITDANGFYRVPALDPGVYVVRTELAGFSTVENPEIPVGAAQEVTLPVTLAIKGVGEAITVTAKAEAIELNKTNPTVAMTRTARQVTELPLGGAARNINNLILQSPNVSASTGQGTYSVNGQRSRNNNFMIDGSDNNDISVTIATSQIVPETVAEFQVLTNPYSVEYGRNSGAQINVITKSGGNAFHGEAWEYYQDNRRWASLTNIQKDSGLTESPVFKRHQFGADIGGPLIKDKTFFFALYQRDIQRPEERPSGTTVRIPTAAGFAALQNVPLRPGQSAASRQAVLERIAFLQDYYNAGLTFRNPTNVLVNGVNIATGQVNVPLVDPSTYNTWFARIDHRLTENDNLSVRYSYNGRKDDGIASTQFGSRFMANQDLKDTNVALSELHTFSGSLLNEFRFSLVKRDLLFPENDPDSPTATISGLFTVGGASNFPQGRVSDAYQFSDTLNWSKGRHAFKFGADVRYNRLDNISAFDSKGTFGFNSLQDFMNNNANGNNRQALQTASFLAKQWQTFFFVQDDFRVTPDLTVNLGLRYELSTTPLGFFGATDPQSLAAMVPGPVKDDTNNWAPRVGFAWSPRGSGLLGDGKTVFRGGFGIGYDVLFYNLLVVNASNFPRVVTLTPTPVVDVYPNKIQGSATATFNPLAAWTNSDENTQNPSSRYWSLSIQRELSDFVVEVGYVGSRSYHGINQIDHNPARVVTPEQAALVASTRNQNAIPSVQARRLNPQFGQRVRIPSDTGPNGVDTEARGKYDGVFVSINKRLSHGLQFNANYTYSKNTSNNDASLGEGGTDGSSQRPQDYFDYDVEWSRGVFDRPHRLSVNYTYELPRPKSGVLKYVLGGWQMSGVTQYQSGRPFTIFTGVDSNGDGNTGSDRPNINPSGTFTWDKDHKHFTNNGFYTVPLGTNNLPLANSLGNGNAPRNGERTASYWNTDLSVLKRFGTGRRQLHIRADLFNAFNQDNYGSGITTTNLGNIMTNPSFGQNTNNWGQRTATVSAKFVF
jgi:Carboxypeptidase regulatory-like domain/TonB-dependent Receptor Plug Domain